MHAPHPLDESSVNTIRMLAVDAVERAKSGHPGLPMEAATLGYVLYRYHLRHAPQNPTWINRDRFVLSAGHGSMLLYALLHLTGYDLSLNDIRQFRQWGSRTPGHPDFGLTPGVETTTGPLGQGFAVGIGMALAERLLGQRYNREGHTIIDYRVFGFVSDGDLMEGVSTEAASFAAGLPLGKLIYVYLSNGVSIEGKTSLTFCEDVQKRFEAYGWHVSRLHDPYNVADVHLAYERATSDSRPSLIIADTRIGYGSPHKEGTVAAHGSPLGPEEVRATKERLHWSLEPSFHVPSEVRAHMGETSARGALFVDEWRARFEAYRNAYPELARELEDAQSGILPETWEHELPIYGKDAGARATREASGDTLQVIAKHVPLFLGGSADLGPSNDTVLEGYGSVTPQGMEENARNLHFGIREHAMGAIANGLALSRAIVLFCATFFVFSDYMRPAIRLAALMKLHVIYVFTHDSIAQGEDGATHQPVEHLASFRAMPNMMVIRPADANETVEAWRVALHHRDGPIALVLTRQNVPIIDRTRYAPAHGVERGAYVLNPNVVVPDYLIVATGSEVALALEVAETLLAEGVRVRVVSMPSWELFEAQDDTYKQSVFPSSAAKRMVIEAASRLGWERYVGTEGEFVTVETFGASAPGEVLLREYGFSNDAVLARVRAHSRR